MEKISGRSGGSATMKGTMPSASRDARTPLSWSLLILLAVPVILLGALLVVFFGGLPGASILLAADCVRDGRCLLSVMYATRLSSSELVGPWAYLLGALCVVLGYLMAWLLVSRILRFFRPSRAIDRSGVRVHALALGYLAADALLLGWLAGLLGFQS
jgi:hypothetical protein